MNQTKTQLNNPHKYVALKATEKLRIKSCSFQLTETAEVDCFVHCTHGLRCHWINNYNITNYPVQVTNQALCYTKWITNKSKLHPCPVVFEDDLLFLAASRARCTSPFQHPAELWKTGMPALGHKTSKMSLIARTSNPGGGRERGVVF